jgi:hypothetical protein
MLYEYFPSSAGIPGEEMIPGSLLITPSMLTWKTISSPGRNFGLGPLLRIRILF